MNMEKAMAFHSSTLAWRIPWTEEPAGLQSMGLRVRHDWVTSLSLFTFMHWRRKWKPTPVFLPGESQGQGSLVGYRLWGRRVGHDWSDLAEAAAAFEYKHRFGSISMSLFQNFVCAMQRVKQVHPHIAKWWSSFTKLCILNGLRYLKDIFILWSDLDKTDEWMRLFQLLLRFDFIIINLTLPSS